MTSKPASVREEQPQAEITLGQTRITLLGTAHISRTSAEIVTEYVQSGDYDAVAVELCPSRHQAVVDPDALARMDLFQVIREGKAAMVTASLALGAYQQRMAEQLGIEPGAEMRAAVNNARDHHLPVLLVDREIGTTLKRIYRNVPFRRRLYLMAGLMASVFSREEVTEEEIERLKEGDILESSFSQFATEAHDLYVPLIEERDRYMALRLAQEAAANGHRHILAVVGAGHLRGIEAQLQAQTQPEPQAIVEELKDLDSLPPPSRWPKVIPWVVVALIVLGFIIGFSRNTELGLQLVLDWVLINGGLAALGALAALAHPLTIIGAFIAAPLTSLNPTISAGLVTATVELFLRKPNVGDFSRLRQDTARLRGWWGNRVARVLLVFLFSTLGSAVGTYLAGFRIFERLTSLNV